MINLKSKVLEVFGGNNAVALICGVTPGAVSQWDNIPAKHQSALLDYAEKHNLDFRPDDFFRER